MQALLTGGPVDGEIRDVPERPPDHIDIEVTIDDLAEVPEGDEYPFATFETHRYVLDSVTGNPSESEPRAKYSWRHKLPD